MTAPDQAPPAYAWIAKLARIDVPSAGERTRQIDPQAFIRVADDTAARCPLTDPQTRPVGEVLSCHVGARWLYAFGLVYDGATAQLMQSGELVPEFALLRSMTRPPRPDGLVVITGGEISAVRAARNPRNQPGAVPPWSGVAFTVEEFA